MASSSLLSPQPPQLGTSHPFIPPSRTFRPPFSFHTTLPLQTTASPVYPSQKTIMRRISSISAAAPDVHGSTQYRKTDGIVIVDHGSRRPQSNSMLHEFVDMFKQKTGHLNVEPAHMELADPTVKDAFSKCVEQGATRIIISPYFLSAGRHWDEDIPALASEAARDHPGISYIVAAPIGLHSLMVDILQDRINYCVSQASGDVPECEMCAGTRKCQFLESSSLR